MIISASLIVMVRPIRSVLGAKAQNINTLDLSAIWKNCGSAERFLCVLRPTLRSSSL